MEWKLAYIWSIVMSNCINFVNPKVFFPCTVLNQAALKAAIEKAQTEINRENCVTFEDDGKSDSRCLWWYVSDVQYNDQGTVIVFGQGRSSHTWRDFQWLLKVLSKFMMQEMELSMQVDDEGFGRCRMDVRFKEGVFS